MSAALAVARAEICRRPAAIAAIAFLVALGTAAVLATGAGARRTSTVVDRYFDVTNTRDVGFFATTLGSAVTADGRELAERIGRRMDHLDGIVDRGVAVGYPTAASPEFDLTIVVSPDRSEYVDIDRPILRAGRLPAAGAPTEVALNDTAARLLGAGVGDTFEAPTFSPQDCAALLGSGGFPGFNGPVLQLQVVGRVLVVEDLRGSETNAVAVGSTAFLDRYGADACATVVFGSARVASGGPSTGEIQSLLDAETRGLQSALVSTVEGTFGRTVRASVGVVSTVLVLLTVAAAVAGALGAAQAIRRQAGAGSEVSRSLAAIGATRFERAVALASPAIVGLGAGVALGVPLAWFASERFPVSIARVLEPAPGRRFDAVVLLPGALAVLLLGSAWALFAARRADLATLHGSADRPSRAAELAARLGLRPPAVIGLRFAYEAGPPRARVPSRSALVGVAAGVLGIAAVLVVVANINGTLQRPQTYGWAWSSMPEVEVQDPAPLVAGLVQSGQVSAAARFLGGSVDVNGRRVAGDAIEDLFGTTELVIAEGRAPIGDDEVALGGSSMADIDASIGEVVEFETSDGAVKELRVVGRAVLPLVGDGTNPGSGAVLTPAALQSLTRGELESKLVLTYPPGANAQATRSSLEQQGFGFSAYADPQPPGTLLNLKDVRSVLFALAAFFGVIALAGVTHALAMSGRRRRPDFAVLRTLGFRRGQVRRTVWCQATAIAVTGSLIGLPLGVVAGRVAWRLAVADLYMLDVVATPAVALALTVFGALAIIATVAIVAGVVVAARSRPAELLRVE